MRPGIGTLLLSAAAVVASAVPGAAQPSGLIAPGRTVKFGPWTGQPQVTQKGVVFQCVVERPLGAGGRRADRLAVVIGGGAGWGVQLIRAEFALDPDRDHDAAVGIGAARAGPVEAFALDRNRFAVHPVDVPGFEAALKRAATLTIRSRSAGLDETGLPIDGIGPALDWVDQCGRQFGLYGAPSLEATLRALAEPPRPPVPPLAPAPAGSPPLALSAPQVQPPTSPSLTLSAPQAAPTHPPAGPPLARSAPQAPSQPPAASPPLALAPPQPAPPRPRGEPARPAALELGVAPAHGAPAAAGASFADEPAVAALGRVERTPAARPALAPAPAATAPAAAFGTAETTGAARAHAAAPASVLAPPARAAVPPALAETRIGKGDRAFAALAEAAGPGRAGPPVVRDVAPAPGTAGGLSIVERPLPAEPVAPDGPVRVIGGIAAYPNPNPTTTEPVLPAAGPDEPPAPPATASIAAEPAPAAQPEARPTLPPFDGPIPKPKPK